MKNKEVPPALVNKRRKTLVSVLLLSCIIASILLFSVNPVERYTVHDLTELDLAFNSELEGISGYTYHIRTSSIEVDSIFTRKIHRVSVEADFPMTLLHSRFAAKVQPWNVTVLGNRHFPERQLEIDVYFAGKQVRKIYLQPTISESDIPQNK